MYSFIDSFFNDFFTAPHWDNTYVTETKPKIKKTENLRLSPPWNTIYRKITAFFKGDDEITVKPLETTGRNWIITIETPNSDKAFALENIMRTEYSFGNVSVKVKFAVTNETAKKATILSDDLYETYLTALSSTPAVTDIKKVKNFVQDEFVIVELKKEVVQFYNDDISDYYGNWNGLYTDIAKEIFKDERGKVIFTIAAD